MTAEVRELEHGTRVLVVGKKIYVTCEACETLVRINKPLIGSLHICVAAA